MGLHTSRSFFSSMADISGLKVKTGVHPHRHRRKRPRSMARHVRGGKGRGRGVGLAARSSLGVKVVIYRIMGVKVHTKSA